MAVDTCSGMTFQNWRFPPDPESRRRTWVCPAEATGSQSLSWCDQLGEREIFFFLSCQSAGGTHTCEETRIFWLTCCNAILQGALVEDVGREGTESRVHAVLDLQADRPDSQHHQSLEQRLRQTRLCRFLTHHHRTQLAVVAHQNQLQNRRVGQLSSSCGAELHNQNQNGFIHVSHSAVQTPSKHLQGKFSNFSSSTRWK